MFVLGLVLAALRFEKYLAAGEGLRKSDMYSVYALKSLKSFGFGNLTKGIELRASRVRKAALEYPRPQVSCDQIKAAAWFHSPGNTNTNGEC